MALPSERTTAANINASDAGRLFLHRATKLAAEFVLCDQNAPAVARLLNRLDGIPLAIELAATQIPALGFRQFANLS